MSVVLSSGGQRLDALSHELGVWQAKPNPEFIRAEQGGLWLRGKPWKAHGVNYMPSTGIGIANYHFFEHWVGRGSYDPVVIEHLGDVLVAEGRLEEAAGFFEKALAKGHEKPDEIKGKLSKVRKTVPSAK